VTPRSLHLPHDWQHVAANALAAVLLAAMPLAQALARLVRLPSSDWRHAFTTRWIVTQVPVVEGRHSLNQARQHCLR
jgi:hypothetical protein